jgi:hypothetical protein
MNVMSLQRRRRADALYDFVERAARLLASDDEVLRCRLEHQLLDAMPQLQASHVFDVFQIRDRALRSVLAGADTEAAPLPTAAARRHAMGGHVAYMPY